MPGRKKFVVGWRGARPPWGADWTVLPLDRLREASGPYRHGTSLILGPDALNRLPPCRVAEVITFPYGVALGLAGPGAEERARAWTEANVALVGDDAALRGRVEALDRLPTRVIVSQAAWAPPGFARDLVLAHAISVLPKCWKIDVEHWNAELGVERHYLNRRFRETVGVEAREICQDYLCEYTDQERARGVTWPLLAAALGFPNPRSLGRAVRRSRGSRTLRAALRMARVPDRTLRVPGSALPVPH